MLAFVRQLFASSALPPATVTYAKAIEKVVVPIENRRKLNLSFRNERRAVLKRVDLHETRLEQDAEQPVTLQRTGTDSRHVRVARTERPTTPAPVVKPPTTLHLVPESPAPAEEDVRVDAADASTIRKNAPIGIQTEADLASHLDGPWRGVLTGVVALAAEGDCLVVSLGCGQVSVIMTEKFALSLHYTAVQKTIEKEWLYRIRQVFYAPASLVIALREKINGLLDRNPDFGLNEDTKFKRLFVDIFESAVRMGASDIHLRTRDDEGEILIRLHGSIRPWLKIPGQLLLDSMSAAFGQFVVPGTTNATQFKSNDNQAFMLRLTVAVEHAGATRLAQMEGRYNHRYHLTGLASVIRLLESSNEVREIPTLSDLGYSESQVELFNLAISRKWGMVLFVGSTGQGKSTTLRTLLTHFPGADREIVYTMESPAEYRYPHAIQFSVPVKTDETSEEISRLQISVVRDFLRMDPDRGMVGEIRDKESAKMAVEFTQSGHPTASTIHGDGAVDALSRMSGDSICIAAEDLGNAKLLNIVVFQRLIPKLCPHCKVSANHPKLGLSKAKRDLLHTKFGLDSGSMYVANPGGCETCKPNGIGMSGNGTKGQTVVAELLLPDEKMRSMIAVRNWHGVTHHWRAQRKSRFSDQDTRGKTAFEHALYQASQGIISPLSIETEFEPFELYEVHPVAIDGERS